MGWLLASFRWKPVQLVPESYLGMLVTDMAGQGSRFEDSGPAHDRITLFFEEDSEPHEEISLAAPLPEGEILEVEKAALTAAPTLIIPCREIRAAVEQLDAYPKRYVDGPWKYETKGLYGRELVVRFPLFVAEALTTRLGSLVSSAEEKIRAHVEEEERRKEREVDERVAARKREAERRKAEDDLWPAVVTRSRWQIGDRVYVVTSLPKKKTRTVGVKWEGSDQKVNIPIGDLLSAKQLEALPKKPSSRRSK